jgi:hypothetical protein
LASPIRFSPPIEAHGHLQRSILAIEEQTVRSSNAVLDLVYRARTKAEGKEASSPSSFENVKQNEAEQEPMRIPSDEVED